MASGIASFTELFSGLSLTYWSLGKITPFADNICKFNFVYEKGCTLVQISLKCVPNGQIYNETALVEIMFWWFFGAKPLSKPLTAYLNDACMHYLTSMRYIPVYRAAYITVWWCYAMSFERIWEKMRYNGTVLYYFAITNTFGICYEVVTHKLTRLYAVRLYIHIYSGAFANQKEMT